MLLMVYRKKQILFLLVLFFSIGTYSQPGSYTYLRIYLDKIEMYQVNVYMKSDNTVKLINSYLYDRSISYCDNLVNEKNVHIYEEPNKDIFFIDCNISKYCNISKNKVINKQPKLIFEIIDVETSGKMYLYCFNFEEMRQHDPVVLCLDLSLTFVADGKYKIKYDDFVELSRKTPYKDAGTQELNLNKILKNVN